MNLLPKKGLNSGKMISKMLVNSINYLLLALIKVSLLRVSDFNA